MLVMPLALPRVATMTFGKSGSLSEPSCPQELDENKMLALFTPQSN